MISFLLDFFNNLSEEASDDKSSEERSSEILKEDAAVKGMEAVAVEEEKAALDEEGISFEMPRSRTVQFSRCFVLSCVRLWNGLHESVFAGEGFGAFKT